MKILAILIAAAALAGGVLVGATQFGGKSEGSDLPQTPAHVQSGPAVEREADCRRDALSDRDADDPKEALANDDCLDGGSDDASGSSDDRDPSGDDRSGGNPTGDDGPDDEGNDP